MSGSSRIAARGDAEPTRSAAATTSATEAGRIMLRRLGVSRWLYHARPRPYALQPSPSSLASSLSRASTISGSGGGGSACRQANQGDSIRLDNPSGGESSTT